MHTLDLLTQLKSGKQPSSYNYVVWYCFLSQHNNYQNLIHIYCAQYEWDFDSCCVEMESNNDV
jgi:hypothetical protein